MKFPEGTPLWFQCVGKPQWMFVLQIEEAQMLTTIEELMGFDGDGHRDKYVAMTTFLKNALLEGIITWNEHAHLRYWVARTFL